VKSVFRAGTWCPATFDQTAASLWVMPGKYHITAKAVARVDDEHLIGEVWARITCRPYRDPLGDEQWIALDQSQTEVSDDGPDVATISLEGVTTVTSSGDMIRFVCRDSDTAGAGYDSMDQIKLFAQQVGSYESAVIAAPSCSAAAASRPPRFPTQAARSAPATRSPAAPCASWRRPDVCRGRFLAPAADGAAT
jgi:hypothetical protein